MISGFLITLVLHETYRFRFIPFAVNRFLRLYPSYFVIAFISMLFALALEGYADFHGSWSVSTSIQDFIGNILIFPWAFFADDIVPVNFTSFEFLHSVTPHFRLVPSTWSVGVEIVCYFLLWFFSARYLWSTIFSIVAACVWQFYILHSPVNQMLAYFPVPAAMLPFSLGALAYHAMKCFRVWKLSVGHASFFTGLVILLFMINWFFSLSQSKFIGSIFYYVNDVLAFFAVLIINRSRFEGKIGKVDRWLGDLAYPMFLGQYVFGFLAWKIAGESSAVRSVNVFLVGAVLTILVSVLLVLVVDRRLLAIRKSVREINSGDGVL